MLSPPKLFQTPQAATELTRDRQGGARATVKGPAFWQCNNGPPALQPCWRRWRKTGHFIFFLNLLLNSEEMNQSKGTVTWRPWRGLGFCSRSSRGSASELRAAPLLVAVTPLTSHALDTSCQLGRQERPRGDGSPPPERKGQLSAEGLHFSAAETLG